MTECGMCLETYSADEMTTRFFFHKDKRYEIVLCLGCCKHWDWMPDGQIYRCIVCRQNRSILDDKGVPITAYTLPLNRGPVPISGALCAECCEAWGIEV